LIEREIDSVAEAIFEKLFLHFSTITTQLFRHLEDRICQ
jgi:hypothetical protein